MANSPENEAENTPMTWLELAQQHLAAVQLAGRIVEGRPGVMRQPDLFGVLENWPDAIADLEDRITRVSDQYESQQLDRKVAESDQVLAQILSDSIQLTSSHLTQVETSERPQTEALELALRNLEHHVESFLGAGPHGPGGGRPDTSGSGNKGGGRTLWRPQFEEFIDAGTHGSGGGRPYSEYTPQTMPSQVK